MARLLAEHGADVNYGYAEGYSPLPAAAANGHLEIVKMLLAYGADLQARLDDGKSALSLAEERGHQKVARHLRELGLTSFSYQRNVSARSIAQPCPSRSTFT